MIRKMHGLAADDLAGLVPLARHHQHIGHLAAVLMPIEVESEPAFAGFLARALAAGLPERLRLVVIDPAEAPRLRALASGNDPRIRHEVPSLDVLTLAQETFAQEPTTGPGGVFRNLLMSLVTLVEVAPAAQVRAKAADAFDFARRHGWNDQQAAVAVLVAGAQLKEGRHDEAIATYRIAGAAAERLTALEARTERIGELVERTARLEEQTKAANASLARIEERLGR